MLLLYGSEEWVMPSLIGRMLDSLHHWVVRRMTGWQPMRKTDGTWVYPPMVEAMMEAGIHEVENYVSRCQRMVEKYISTRSIMDLFLAAEQCLGTRVLKRWWQKECLDMEGMRKSSQAEELEM